MGNLYYVYFYIKDETNEVFYIGKGKNDRAYKGKRNIFCENIKNKYNWSVYIYKDGLSEQEAFDLEVEMIKEYKEKGHKLTNFTEGGGGISGYVMSKEIKEKISKSSKEKWKDNTFKDNQMWHRKHGVYKSKEFREKISEIVKGENNPNYGNKWTQEMKDNLSKYKKEKGMAKGINNPRATKIMCVETGKIYDYIKLASEEYKLKSQASITIALDNPNRTAGGVHWKRI